MQNQHWTQHTWTTILFPYCNLQCSVEGSPFSLNSRLCWNIILESNICFTYRHKATYSSFPLNVLKKKKINNGRAVWKQKSRGVLYTNPFRQTNVLKYWYPSTYECSIYEILWIFQVMPRAATPSCLVAKTRHLGKWLLVQELLLSMDQPLSSWC